MRVRFDELKVKVVLKGSRFCQLSKADLHYTTFKNGKLKVESGFKAVGSYNYKFGASPPFIGGGLGWGLINYLRT